ncbi:baseplate J/gp47 family protein, partial [Shinella kummerowiae]|uniref:baseplate J/gp47 family protein n=1 Tax=Shinella kummerowiae TaxID=417745 RepID=UPI0021B67C2E
EAIASRLGVIRAAGENDLQFLERYLLKLARPSAGSLLGYLGRVMEAWPARGDVAILGPEHHGRRGDIDVILAAPEGAAVSPSIISKVQTAVTSPDAKPLTDVVATHAASIVSYEIRQRITVAEDRSAAPILAAAKAAATAFVRDRYAIGLPIKRSAIIATSYVPGVVAVEDLTNGADVYVSADAVAWCSPSGIVVQVAT